MNGAGKTTLLRLLTRITEPTEGRALIKVELVLFWRLEQDFTPELSGLENIYVNGIMLGMTRAEVKDKLDEIIEFSGVEKYINTRS